uniref:Ig-like domain-containing protein n=1 Tax=Oreochromis niloticus TaxID=8128 RepID=I3K7R4_ORENI
TFIHQVTFCTVLRLLHNPQSLCLHCLVSALFCCAFFLVAPGDIAILSCAVPNKESIGAVMWIRSDLNPEKELFYQSNASDPSTQPPHYMNRVRLVNTDMENGELSLFLYDTTFGDDGTYECHVTQVGTSNSKAAILKTTPIKIIKLTVGEFVEEMNLLPGACTTKQVQHSQIIFSFVWFHMKVVIKSVSQHWSTVQEIHLYTLTQSVYIFVWNKNQFRI